MAFAPPRASCIRLPIPMTRGFTQCLYFSMRRSEILRLQVLQSTKQGGQPLTLPELVVSRHFRGDTFVFDGRKSGVRQREQRGLLLIEMLAQNFDQTAGAKDEVSHAACKDRLLQALNEETLPLVVEHEAA